MRRLLALSFGLVLTTTVQAQPRPMPASAFDGIAFPAHWARQPLLDEARAAARVDVAWERFGVLGRGATVCVIDTGVDLAHRDFRDAADHTRADWMLDLDASPRGSEPALEVRFGGAVYRRDEIDAMLAAGDTALPGDWHGHGTAMASAALGDDAPPGIDAPGRLAGVAPAARLVVVRALRRGVGGFRDEDIVRGAAFCAAVVDPSRAIVLLSLGGHDGAHDGTSPMERALAALVHRGLTVVAAAGNDGGRTMHAAARVATSSTVSIALTVPAPEHATDAHVAVAVRGSARVALVAPDGVRVGVASAGEHATASSTRGAMSADATRDGVVDLVISGSATRALSGGAFTIEVTGPAELDAWIVSEALGAAPFGAAFTGASAIEGEEVTMPATSESVIAVGANVSRAALVTGDGSPTLTLDADAEGRALFSSRGPSASGSARPDVLAPGGWIVAARSSGVDPSDPEALTHGSTSDWSRLSQPDQRLAIAGTSVAAAIVAGALALAAETAPLDPERDRDALVFSATRTEPRAFTAARGFGALDAAAFLEARRTTSAVPTTGVLSASRAFTTPGATALSLALVTDVPADAWVTFERDGVVVGRTPLRAGVARLAVASGRAAPRTTIHWSARRDDGALLATSETPVAWTDDGSDAIASGGAGCAVARRERGRAICFALATLACWAALRRSRTLKG